MQHPVYGGRLMKPLAVPILLLLAAVLAAGVTSCGQKGGLTRPEQVATASLQP